MSEVKQKNYLEEYIINRIHELEYELQVMRKERDQYKHILSEV